MDYSKGISTQWAFPKIILSPSFIKKYGLSQEYLISGYWKAYLIPGLSISIGYHQWLTLQQHSGLLEGLSYSRLIYFLRQCMADSNAYLIPSLIKRYGLFQGYRNTVGYSRHVFGAINLASTSLKSFV
jgi:hypothetical protein